MNQWWILMLLAPVALVLGTSAQTQKSVTGQWNGSWINSKGTKGTSTFNLTEAPDGTITGYEDGATDNQRFHRIIEDGRRNGNYLAWNYSNQSNGCRDFAVAIKLSDDGNEFSGKYMVADQCAKPATYTGQFLNYTSSNTAGPTKKASGASCFANDPGAGSTDRAAHARWAETRNASQLAENLKAKLHEIYGCAAMNDQQLARLFGEISVTVARYVPDATCFGGDSGAIGTDADTHRRWAIQAGRQKSLENLNSKVARVFGCLKRSQHSQYFADVSLAIAETAK